MVSCQRIRESSRGPRVDGTHQRDRCRRLGRTSIYRLCGRLAALAVTRISLGQRQAFLATQAALGRSHTEVVEIARSATESEGASDTHPERGKGESNGSPPPSDERLGHIKQQTVEEEEGHFDAP